MWSFCESGCEQLTDCHVPCRCRVRQQPEVAPRWSRSAITPTPQWAARIQSPILNWSQTPANERGTPATRRTRLPAIAPGKTSSNYRRFLTNPWITFHCTNVQLNCCHLWWYLCALFLSIDYFVQRRTAYKTVVPRYYDKYYVRIQYNTAVLQLPTVFSTVTCCTGL